MKDFRSLKVWAKSHALALRVYEATKTFPREEIYGLTAQLRRAATSIPTNIAEGCGRGTNAELARFLTMALGSASEVEYLLLLARDLHYLADYAYGELDRSVVEAKRMLAALLKKVRQDRASAARP